MKNQNPLEKRTKKVIGLRRGQRNRNPWEHVCDYIKIENRLEKRPLREIIVRSPTRIKSKSKSKSCRRKSCKKEKSLVDICEKEIALGWLDINKTHVLVKWKSRVAASDNDKIKSLAVGAATTGRGRFCLEVAAP